jgi:hypothetical protein
MGPAWRENEQEAIQFPIAPRVRWRHGRTVDFIDCRRASRGRIEWAGERRAMCMCDCAFLRALRGTGAAL